MTSGAANSPAGNDPNRRARSRGGGWWTSLILGLALLLIYSANARDLGTDDTVATTLLPLAFVRGDGLTLDRFPIVLQSGPAELPPFVVRSRGHIVSRYPVAPALVILPLVAPQVLLMDRIRAGWDRDPTRLMMECKWMAKRSMGVLMALAAVWLHRVMLGLGLRRTAVPAVLSAFLGSDLWTHASQALWQHGPAALALIAAMGLLYPGPRTRRRLLLAGVATAGLFAVRLVDTLLAAVIVAWVVRSEPRRRAWFLPAPVLGVA